MGHTNSTTYYNLPQFVTSDKPAWLTDINGAFSAIDSAVHTAQGDATTAGNNATQALSDASAAQTAASTADAKGTGAVASLADAFDTTATYAVGDLVMYNSLLYICSTAVTTPGPWTGTTHWSRSTVEGQIAAHAGELPLGSTTPAGSTAKAIADLKPTSYTFNGTTSGAGLLVTDIDWTIGITQAFAIAGSVYYSVLLRPSTGTKVVALVVDDNFTPKINTAVTLYVYKSNA